MSIRLIVTTFDVDVLFALSLTTNVRVALSPAVSKSAEATVHVADVLVTVNFDASSVLADVEPEATLAFAENCVSSTPAPPTSEYVAVTFQPDLGRYRW